MGKFTALLMILMLVACGGGGDTGQPTDDVEILPEGTTEASPTEIPEGPNVIVATRLPTREPFELEVPLPGTLVASETEDPDAGTVFTRLKVERYSGPEGSEHISVEVFGDGSYIRNGVPGTITPEQVTELVGYLDNINFFGLQGNMLGPNPNSNAFRYRITVERGSNARALNMEEGYFPQELNPLILTVLRIGQ